MGASDEKESLLLSSIDLEEDIPKEYKHALDLQVVKRLYLSFPLD